MSLATQSYRFITLVLLSLFCRVALAQVVITESVLTDRLGTTDNLIVFDTESSAGLQVLVDADGEDQTWDFTTITFTDSIEVVQSFISLPAELPGSDIPEFAAADFVEFTTGVEDMDTVKTLLYQSLNAGNLLSHGIISIGKVDGIQDTMVILASPPARDGVLPFEYEMSYSDSSALIIDGAPEPTYTITDVRADGWGTLVTPRLSAPALRLFNTELTYLTSSGQLLDAFYSIDFLTATGLTAEIELDENMQPVSASYAVVEDDVSTHNEYASDEAPEQFSLDQNYPNPFNPSTQISFEIHAAAHSTLNIYAPSGQLVETLIDGFLPAGAYKVAFINETLASGTYLYKLEAGSFVQTRVMHLVK